MPKLTYLYLVVFSAVIMTACSDKPADLTLSQKPAIKAHPVELATPEIGVAAGFYETTSTFEPSSDAQINARASGVIRKINREEGDDVKKGDVLMLLEDKDQQLRLKQAKQTLASAQREYERLNKMRQAGAVSANEWETANNTFLQAQTDFELAELALSYTKISAPFNGRIVWREVDSGDFVASGALVFRMMSIKPLLVKVHIPANRIGQIATGQAVELEIESIAKILVGEIDLVSPIVDPKTGTIKVTVKLNDYPNSVRPGDFTGVKMITHKKDNAILVPSIALIEERGLHHLFVGQGDKVVRKNVQVGYVVDDKTEIINGLDAADQIVVKGQRNLNDGDLIKVISVSGSESNKLEQSSE